MTNTFRNLDSSWPWGWSVSLRISFHRAGWSFQILVMFFITYDLLICFSKPSVNYPLSYSKSGFYSGYEIFNIFFVCLIKHVLASSIIWGSLDRDAVWTAQIPQELGIHMLNWMLRSSCTMTWHKVFYAFQVLY